MTDEEVTLNRRLAIPVGITATGQHYPERVVNNDELARMMDTSDEWITSRTGIQERRWVEPGTATSDLGAKALQMALDRRGIAASELDLIIACTVTPDHFFPSTAALIQEKVGASQAYGFDLNAACSGFLFGLTTACSMVAGGTVNRVAVVGCEVMTSIIDKTDRNTAVLFGDGAGAVIVERVEEGYGLLDFEQRIDGTGAPFLNMPAGGSREPSSVETLAARKHFIHQQGQEVFKNAVKAMSDYSRMMVDRNHLTGNDIKLLIPHQANIRIMEAVAKRLGLSEERMANNICKYANTTAATIPTALHQALEAGQVHKGDHLVFTAFGAGFTYGACLLRWAY